MFSSGAIQQPSTTAKQRELHVRSVSSVAVGGISILPGRRALDMSVVEGIAASLKATGVMVNPITLREVDEDWILVCGLHRLEAAKLAGWKNVECYILGRDDKEPITDLEAEMLEIDENLLRNELKGPEKDRELLHRKKVYEKMNPETKNGAKTENLKKGRLRKNCEVGEPADKQNEIKRFTLDTAEKLGVSERTVQAAVARAEKAENAALGLPPKQPKAAPVKLAPPRPALITLDHPQLAKLIEYWTAASNDVRAAFRGYINQGSK